MATPSQQPAIVPAASQDRADDEKTLRAEREYSEKKDLEAGRTRSLTDCGADSIKPQQSSQEVEFALEDDVPDGGLKAWTVVAGASLGTLATFGFVNAWGVFQAYYEQTLLKDTSPSTIAWIGSIQYALVFVPGLVTGRLFDKGMFRVPLAVSSVFLVAATFLVAQCKEYWQFLLCQGFAVGLGAGVIFGPLLGVVAHWFKRRKGLALGVVAVGSSLGGTLFPIAIRNLIQEVGFQWTMRIVGFILLATLTFTNLTLSRRLPPRDASGPFINLQAFRNPAYTFYCAAGFVTFLGLYTVLTYIDVSAAFVGLDPNFSFYLVSVANAGSIVGRLAGGILADKYGALNVMIPATFIAGILTYVWPFVTNKGGYVAVGLIYGISSGVFVSMLAAPLVEMGETHDVGLRLGMFFTVLAFGALCGPPISGAINEATDGFKAVGYYAGSAVLVSVVLLILVRQLVLRRLWGKT
ncbi:uncharacterized protein PHACADRAFT_255517 [Phanerochaete carnosa HHB-10118-sp]|uniref:Major facilitator superfamily (MFS) profile domain-containing protein n=1 Tax=Phanerochaete carnosa (strain HHB-10118-sp) TaxID=650164 RepID=K5UYB3_PHACS|nr:uncharacterized protein PHACADRAFT_255517 [Phanerochaete carnosa HHB-10118-sp]EKM55121.1 hypothetical protein PHACADRAFT_255517 [Phanerochaete carnosa HHB-10118-sp]